MKENSDSDILNKILEDSHLVEELPEDLKKSVSLYQEIQRNIRDKRDLFGIDTESLGKAVQEYGNQLSLEDASKEELSQIASRINSLQEIAAATRKIPFITVLSNVVRGTFSELERIRVLRDELPDMDLKKVFAIGFRQMGACSAIERNVGQLGILLMETGGFEVRSNSKNIEELLGTVGYISSLNEDEAKTQTSEVHKWLAGKMWRGTEKFIGTEQGKEIKPDRLYLPPLIHHAVLKEFSNVADILKTKINAEIKEISAKGNSTNPDLVKSPLDTPKPNIERQT